ncbi:uncharacterized protein LOC126262993 isoform X1 [Schistocerca nitens]|uniref:uncharacterized protein LOC126262993 isoform X1 n=2 Tax=Schistocerca nitens TaxID=7011 RepID=UPI002118F96A|nr:uncharacterized protein LOC126262993 isoform X1 [Schistocerca nitens]
MHPGDVAARLLLFLAANGTAVLDCFCNHVNGGYQSNGLNGLNFGEITIFLSYCHYPRAYSLLETCENLDALLAVVPAVASLVQPPTDVEQCAGAPAVIRGLTAPTPRDEAFTTEHRCLIAADCIDSCYAQGLDGVEWDLETLATDHLRRPVLSQLLHVVYRISKAIRAEMGCADVHPWNVYQKNLHASEVPAVYSVFLEHLSNYSRDAAQLLSLGVTRVSQLFVPLAFEHMDTRPNDQQLHGWIKDVERVRDMLNTKLRGLVHDLQSVSEMMVNYKMEQDENNPGNYLIRRPLLNHQLLAYHERYLSFHDELSALCEQQHPKSSQMFALADALYSFCRNNWIETARVFNEGNSSDIYTVDEEWELEDRSYATLSVDTDCLQLLANALDHPTCPLEDLSPETITQREQCRVQLWNDVVERSPHIPVTSYLAYTQRANVNLCLLAWMTVNSFSICQDVPFSMIQSVHDARCFFSNPANESCPEVNVTGAICSFSRAVLLLKCRDFSLNKHSELCSVSLYPDGSYSNKSNVPWIKLLKGHIEPTERTLNYKASLNSATLKYKDFRIDSLKVLEMSFIAINIVFRFLTAGVYMYLPQLRNLPGKIFLSFQLTGIIQILCSEVMYRMTGVPKLSTAVQIDSSLTLLSCIWLNSFCYQMYACIRHLRLPNDLLPAEASEVFRRQVVYALIPWGIVSAASISLENTSKYYLIHSRIIFLAAISFSVALNLVLLGLVGYMYLRNRNLMRRLKISSNHRFGSKKQLVFLSVKTVFLSGVGIIVRTGFHQAQGIAQFVYYVHIATMAQGPLLFVFFICNESTLPLFKATLLAWWKPDIVRSRRELCSAAERNLAKRADIQHSSAESSM